MFWFALGALPCMSFLLKFLATFCQCMQVQRYHGNGFSLLGQQIFTFLFADGPAAAALKRTSRL